MPANMSEIATRANVRGKLANTYRPDLDGLRAIAIVLVVMFHAFPALVPGGFVGVDVFFVVSGYLIGGLVFDQAADGRFSLLEFWARRACRLLPALLLVLTCAMIVGWAFLLPDEWWSLGKHVRASATYLSNFVLFHEVRYFDTAAETKPLLHLWSLAVEAQFYVLFPLLAVVLTRTLVAPVLTVLLVASFIYGLIDLPRNPAAAYFLPQSRVWELLAGVLLARFGDVKLPGRGLAAAGGLIAILAAAMMFNRDMPFPGWRAVVPVSGALAVVAAGPTVWLNRRLLAHPWAVWIGLVSYPLYLWHWTLLSFARISGGAEVSVALRIALAALACALAMVTYRWLERPLRFGPLPRRRLAGVLVALCAVAALGGEAAYKNMLTPYASRFGLDRLVAAAGEVNYFDGMTLTTAGGRKAWRQNGGAGTVMFVGDSNIEQYAPRMEALVRSRPGAFPSVLFMTGGGCAPIPAIRDPQLPGCGNLFDAAYQTIANERIETVVLGGVWWSYFTSTRHMVGNRSLADPAARAEALESLGRAIRRFSAGGRRVVVVLDIPMGPELDPHSAVRREWFAFSIHRMEISRGDLEARYGEISRQIAAIAREEGAEVIDPLPFLCNVAFCPASTEDGLPIYRDASHLRPSYARESLSYLDTVLQGGVR